MSHVPRYLRFEQKLAAGWVPPQRHTSQLSSEVRDRIIERDGTCCYLCGLDCRPNEIKPTPSPSAWHAAISLAVTTVA